ncbi:heterochromatin protein 1-like [Teleopsis dalmanni]|uniref:heterochromatin protein 1-like n=1 Tax=Teleopsis dalmanni TaxID=139649 RepID=UPI0018CF51C6|nr:heterochromatin protein 1-like [Teleopsis dalmanni]
MKGGKKAKVTNSKATDDNVEVSEDEEEEEYVVEKICGRRVRKGKFEYFLKWKGYSEEENTWDPEEHLYCQDLIEQYEAERTKDEAGARQKSEAKDTSNRPFSSTSNKREPKDSGTSSSNSANKKKRRESEKYVKPDGFVGQNEVYGFDKGLVAEKILGASDSNGSLTFFIQFRGVDQAEMIPASVVNLKMPQMVIKFYEERLSWHTDNED